MSTSHMQAKTGADTERRAARLTLAALSSSMLLSTLGTSIANVALPTLADAFAPGTGPTKPAN